MQLKPSGPSAIMVGALVVLASSAFWLLAGSEQDDVASLTLESTVTPAKERPRVFSDPEVHREVEPLLERAENETVAEVVPASVPTPVPISGWKSFDPEKSKKLYPLPWDHWEGELPKVPLFVYEDKYAGFSADDLRLAKKELDDTYKSSVEAMFDRLYDEGDYTTHFIQYEDDGNGGKRPVGMHISRSGDTPLFKVISGHDANGQMTRDFMWLRPEDDRYREIYLMMRELNWVASKVAKADYLKMVEKGHL